MSGNVSYILDVATDRNTMLALLAKHAGFNETHEDMWANGRIIYLQDFKKFAESRGAHFRW